MDFWEESFRNFAIFSFSVAVTVLQPVSTKELAAIQEVDTRPFGAILLTVEHTGASEWVRSLPLISVKVR